MVIPHYINATISDHPFTDYWDIFVLKRRNPYNVALHVLGVYTFTGRFHLRPPVTLALWLPDRLIPFIDWTIWIYALQYLLLYGCFLSVKSATAISRLVYAISLASLLAFCVFLI